MTQNQKFQDHSLFETEAIKEKEVFKMSSEPHIFATF